MEKRGINLWVARATIGVATAVVAFAMFGLGYSSRAALIVLLTGSVLMLVISAYAYVTRKSAGERSAQSHRTTG